MNTTHYTTAAGILATLEAALAENAAELAATAATGARPAWAHGITAAHRKDGAVMVLKAAADKYGLVPEVLDQLDSIGALAKSRDVRLNGERRPVYIVDIPALKKYVKDCALAAQSSKATSQELKGLQKTVQVLAESSNLHQKVDSLTERLLTMASTSIQQGRKAQQKAPRFADPCRSEKKLAGVPTLFLSDWHFDEVVDPRQIEGKNEYNHDIAVSRANLLFETTGKLLFTHMAGAYYDGLVVAIGGDMLSGMIHDELRRTNEQHISESIMELATLLASHLRQLAGEFVEVYVPCVVGNHGRMDKKPQMKGYVKDNFEYLVFVMLKALLADLPNVQVDVSESFDARYQIYGWRYRMTHGNQAKGGSGVGGFWPSLSKLDMRKRKLEGDFDYLILGHFHQRGRMSNMIVNGSLKGYDEYAFFSAFDYQPAEQSLWVTHPEHGITFEMPVIVQEPRTDRRSDIAITPVQSACAVLPGRGV